MPPLQMAEVDLAPGGGRQRNRWHRLASQVTTRAIIFRHRQIVWNGGEIHGCAHAATLTCAIRSGKRGTKQKRDGSFRNRRVRMPSAWFADNELFFAALDDH